MNVIEPGIATQDDFVQVSEEGKIRELTTPIRYHGVGIGSVVASGAFDRLRDEYLKETQPTWVGKCTLCEGDVHTGQQFLRTVVERIETPYISHIACEEKQSGFGKVSRSLLGAKIKYQAREIQSQQAEIIRLQTVLANVRTALGNFGQLIAVRILDKEEVHAISKGEEQGSSFQEYSYGGRSGQTTEASCGDSSIESGQIPVKEFSSEQAGTGPVTDGPYNFRVDDVMDGEPVDANGNKYKWNPKFNYDNGPYLPPDDDVSSRERYGYTTRVEPPMYEFAPKADNIVSCCE